MKTSELFEQIQDKIILDLKENETPCPKCKGLRFYYVESNSKGYVEACRECYEGKLYVCGHCGNSNRTDYCNCTVSREARYKKSDKSRYEKSEKLTRKQYDGWVYADGLGDNEGYFENVDVLMECCEDNGIDEPD